MVGSTGHLLASNATNLRDYYSKQLIYEKKIK